MQTISSGTLQSKDINFESFIFNKINYLAIISTKVPNGKAEEFFTLPVVYAMIYVEKQSFNLSDTEFPTSPTPQNHCGHRR